MLNFHAFGKTFESRSVYLLILIDGMVTNVSINSQRRVKMTFHDLVLKIPLAGGPSKDIEKSPSI
jgi:hypothetical protein